MVNLIQVEVIKLKKNIKFEIFEFCYMQMENSYINLYQPLKGDKPMDMKKED